MAGSAAQTTRQSEANAAQAMKRYELYWARLDPVEGSKIGKTRPCVIVSDDLRNSALSTVVVCPLTSVVRPRWRTRLQVRCAGAKADICADQIRTVAKSRLIRRIGALEADHAKALRELLHDLYAAA